MAAGTTIKHKRKAGAFVDGELAAGEMGLDVAGDRWYYSTNGTTVTSIAAGGDMLKEDYDSNDDGKVNTAEDADELGGVPASDYALKTYVDDAIADLVDSSPSTLDTLNELAAALGDDANFASTVTTALGGKASTSHNHNASDINAGDLAAARMQVNLKAALEAVSQTFNSANTTIDGGTL